MDNGKTDNNGAAAAIRQMRQAPHNCHQAGGG